MRIATRPLRSRATTQSAIHWTAHAVSRVRFTLLSHSLRREVKILRIACVATTLALATIATRGADAQVPAATASRAQTQELQGLRRALEQRQAVEVNRAAVVNPAPAPAAAAAAAAANVARRMPPSNLQITSGVLYRVPVVGDEDRRLNEALGSRIQGSGGDVQTHTVTAIPGLIRQLAKDGTQVQLKPYILAGEPLSYRADLDVFLGSIRVGVADLFDDVDGRALSAPVTFEVLEQGLARPNSISVDKTSPPHQIIEIRVSNPQSVVTIHVATRFQPEGVKIDVPVAPTLVLHAERAEIQGYGLESTSVRISAIGPLQSEGRRVQLSAMPSAFFTPGEVVLDAQGTGTVDVRSDNTGPVSITASAPGYTPGSARLNFLSPTRTLVAGGIGGLGGGLIRLLPRLRKGLSSTRLFIALVVAVLVGLLVFGLYAIGVNVLPVKPTMTAGAIFVLVFAAAGAYLGTGALSRLRSPPDKN